MRLLDLFCGRWGWSRAFAGRGWECVGVDLVEPPEIPDGCTFVRADVLKMSIGPICGKIYFADDGGDVHSLGRFDIICTSSPCEQFSVHAMKHFHPNPPYPELGIQLFNHTRSLCEASGVPYVMENVRAAQQFVGNAVNHCGPFYLWGSSVPPLMPQNIVKGIKWPRAVDGKRDYRNAYNWSASGSKARADATASVATIPPELSACVADYAMRLLEVPA